MKDYPVLHVPTLPEVEAWEAFIAERFPPLLRAAELDEVAITSKWARFYGSYRLTGPNAGALALDAFINLLLHAEAHGFPPGLETLGLFMEAHVVPLFMRLREHLTLQNAPGVLRDFPRFIYGRRGELPELCRVVGPEAVTNELLSWYRDRLPAPVTPAAETP